MVLVYSVVWTVDVLILKKATCVPNTKLFVLHPKVLYTVMHSAERRK